MGRRPLKELKKKKNDEKKQKALLALSVHFSVHQIASVMSVGSEEYQ